MARNYKQAFIRSCVVVVTIAICGCAGYLAFRPKVKALAEGTFVPATQLATQEQIDRAISSSIKVTEEVTREYLYRHATALKLKSGGTDYTVLRFTAKETCGFSGCLYVVINGSSQASRSLNLVDLSNGQLFAASKEKHCIIARQPISGRTQDFDICSN